MLSSKTVSACEQLESRTFFSLTPQQAVAADKVKLKADEAQLTADRKSYGTIVNADRKHLSTDITTAVNAATAQVKADVKQEQQTILTDNKNGNATLAADRTTISADKKAVTADKKDPVAEAAAIQKLASDKSMLTTDTANLKTTIANDRSTFSARIKTDQSLLNMIRKNGNTAITADKNTLAADLKSSSKAIGADLKTISADGVQLAKDELAEIGSTITNLF